MHAQESNEVNYINACEQECDKGTSKVATMPASKEDRKEARKKEECQQAGKHKGNQAECKMCAVHSICYFWTLQMIEVLKFDLGIVQE